MILRMVTLALVNIYIFASVTQWFRHWPVMTEVVGCSPVIFKESVVLTCKQTCVNWNSKDTW